MQDSGHDPTRIEDGSYRADVLRGGTVEPFWYYVIRRNDSNEVIHIANFEYYEQALKAARTALDRMAREAAAG
jgi:hypothetical protein